MASIDFYVANCPSQDLAKTNLGFVAPGTLGGLREAQLEIGPFVYTVREDPGVEPGKLGLNAIQRRALRVSSGDRVPTVSFAVPKAPFQVALLSCEVALVSRRSTVDVEIDAAELTKACQSRFAGQIFSVGQPVAFELHGTNLLATVTGVEVVEGGKGRPTTRGLLLPDTGFNWEARQGGGVKVAGQRALVSSALFRGGGDISFSQLGIGGLDSQFHEMFRRAFHSRLLSPELAQRLGIKHVKGMLLYGPPGTGKTLIARQIGKMLVGKEPKVVNGPEILNKYVGASEENIRALFRDAEEDQAHHGDASELHVIIFDEIDAICKSRGSVRDGSGVHDTVVNQLLTKIDGVDALNNILVIGMTNRKEMLDEALLREGRLEVHLEIGLPDEGGRRQILDIHTRKQRENGFLGADVDLDDLAKRTQNFSGAELEGLVRAATSWALDREVDLGDLSRTLDDKAIRVTRADFDLALTEVIPAFGAETDALAQAAGEGPDGTSRLVDDASASLADAHAELRALAEVARNAKEATLLTAVLHGERGTGKTALAARVAREAGFPYAKLLGPEALAGLGEAQKGAKVIKTFEDAYRTPLSMIVLDDVERLLEYVFLGPRFSNSVLQDLLTCLARTPPPGRRLLVILTTSTHRVLQLLGGPQAFTEEHQLEPLDADGVRKAILAVRTQGGPDHAEAADVLAPAAQARGIPIKRLMLLFRLAADAAGEGRQRVPRHVYERLISHSRILPPTEDYLGPSSF